MYIGVDYGSKRVGIAVSDEQDKIAFPLETVATHDALERVCALAKERSIETVVVGESKDLHGRDNAIMHLIAAFADTLQKNNLRVIFEPEFFTSVQASRSETPEKRLDASAAALILQSFLDRH